MNDKDSLEGCHVIGGADLASLASSITIYEVRTARDAESAQAFETRQGIGDIEVSIAVDEAANFPQELWKRLELGGFRFGEFCLFVGGRSAGKSVLNRLFLEQDGERCKEAFRRLCESYSKPLNATELERALSQMKVEPYKAPPKPKNAPHGPQKLRKGKTRRW